MVARDALQKQDAVGSVADAPAERQTKAAAAAAAATTFAAALKAAAAAAAAVTTFSAALELELAQTSVS